MAEPDVNGGGHVDDERASGIEDACAVGGAEVDGLGDEVEGIIGGLGGHAVGAEGGGAGGRGEGVDAALAAEKLSGKAEVGVDGGADGADSSEGVVEGEGAAPHEVGDDKGRGARGAAAAVDESAAAWRGTGALEEVKCIVEDRGEVLSGRVAEPQRPVGELAAEVVGAGGAGAVEHVGDAMAAEGRAVTCHRVATQVDVVVNAGDVAVAVVRSSRGSSGRSGGGGGRGGPVAGVVGGGAGPSGEWWGRREREAAGFGRPAGLGIGVRVRIGNRAGGPGG